MIIVTATMWPGGSAAGSYELLNATITNQGGTEEGDGYFAHVLARPASGLGVVGYEADVEVKNHLRQDGLVPLLISALASAHFAPGADRITPPSRVMARLSLQDAFEFEQRIRART